MPVYDKTILGRQAAGMGFIRDTLEKVLRLAEILGFMNADPLLSETLALKGGTAINLTFFDLPRLSVDIDLDYTRANALEAMFTEREQIGAIINRYMNGAGYQLSRKTKRHHSLDSTVWTYMNSAGISDNIKIEINYSMRAHVLPPEQRPILLSRQGAVTTLAPIEVFASKIVALLTRAAARDLYDLDHMIKASLFVEPGELDLLRRCVVFYLAVGTDTVPDPLDHTKIIAITPRKIRTDLQPVLRKRDWFDLATAQHRVTTYLEALMQLKPFEQDFLRKFRAGLWQPELLFDTPESENVAQHPMALWKLNGGVRLT
jgi:predicted nucleotidyltransferase component of viral defense system